MLWPYLIMDVERGGWVGGKGCKWLMLLIVQNLPPCLLIIVVILVIQLNNNSYREDSFGRRSKHTEMCEKGTKSCGVVSFAKRVLLVLSRDDSQQ